MTAAPRRPFALGAKIALVVALVVAVFWTARLRCWGDGCTCTPQLVDTYTHPYSRSGVLAVNSTTGLLYSSADDAMELAVFALDDVMSGPLFSVPTEGYLSGIAVDEAANKVYVSHGFSKSVRVVDGATHDHHDIVVPDVKNALGSVVVDPVRQRLYVVRSDDLNVAMFDAATERFIRAVGKGCCSTSDIRLALDRTTGLLLVLEPGKGRLTAFNPEDGTDRALADIDVGGPTLRMAVDEARHRAYIAHDEPQHLVVVDIEPLSPSAFTVIAHIPLRDRPTDIALDPAANVGYVTNNGTNTLSLIDLVANRWIMDVPVGYQPGYLAVDPAAARLYVMLGNQGVAIVQGCRAVRGGLAGLWGMMRRPEPPRESRAFATPVDRSDPTEAAERRAYVLGERMFVNRTQCIDGVTTYEAALAVAEVERAGARVVDGGAAGQFCGVDSAFPQPDMAAAGYFYSVPVLEPGADAPTVWTFESATRTMLTTERPAALRVTRAVTAPETPWRESLWWLSRCKTKVLGEECAR